MIFMGLFENMLSYDHVNNSFSQNPLFLMMKHLLLQYINNGNR